MNLQDYIEKMKNVQENLINFIDNEYFSPELKPFYDEFKQKNENKKKFRKVFERVQNLSQMYFNDFNQKRKTGENEDLIYEIIRKDSIEDFITYVSRESYSLKSFIESSIFETNPLLLEVPQLTLIEYAVFFGSVQIFKYLYKNDVEHTKSLWLYAIHGRNEEIIHILEENKIDLKNAKKYKYSELGYEDYCKFKIIFSDLDDDDDSDDEDEEIKFSVENCFTECILCHHNDVANYIEQNFYTGKWFVFINNFIRFYNFCYFPQKMQTFNFFFNACKYNYFTIVEILLKTKDINDTYILRAISII